MRVRGDSFVDENGRTLMLRGVNLGGSSKVPFIPNGATHLGGGFLDHRGISFVGRPFPLDEADEHLARLHEWGFTFLRLLVSWEAVEHAGPGIYDEEYLDYLRAVVGKANAFGMSICVDPHQDMWSRFSGGDGAPGWTLEAAGFDLARLDETGAAITHQVHGDPFPRMTWPTNGGKLAAATMFTLFFGGDDFAPRALIHGERAQGFLQRHYIGAIARVAERLADMPNVIGYGTMNEPLTGYIGCTDLNRAWGQITLGDGPTPFQGMALGAGVPQEVGVWRLGRASMRRTGSRLLNGARVRVWRAGEDCPWRRNGVWDFGNSGEPVLLRPDHFARVNGRGIDFARDYFRPFANRFAREVRSVDPRAVIFLEAEAGRWPPAWGAGDAPGVVFAPHWYDGLLLVTKSFSAFLAYDSRTEKIVVGRGAVRRSMAGQLADLKRGALDRLNGAPTVLGEFGIPFDLNGGKSYRNGSFRTQVKALERSFEAIEANLLNCAIWNYTADNTNAHGDLWNGEDLSIFSRDQRADPRDINSGGRALRALLRPYPAATAGNLLRASFDSGRRRFEFQFRHDPAVSAPTEIFVPNLQYPLGYDVRVSDGTCEVRRGAQMLLYMHGWERDDHTLTISPSG
ncbi:MAG: cellulase family glycosylhydrolase [Spirochaetes bacterium]|nr:cellulase family glycosylhydrolase [Spirochaetota bacterium]